MRVPPVLEPRSPCCNEPRRSRRHACSAGATPTITLVPSATANVKMATDGSMPISATRGRAAGPVAVSASISTRATTMPSAPPRTPRMAVSARTCPTMRPREAPSAARTASSCWWAVARTRNEPGDVRAGHEQNEHDGSEQHPQHRRGSAGHFFVQ